MESLKLIEIVGTIAFSFAGAFAAMKKRLDIFGVFIIAFVTALGGGTLRDILIGELPVKWMLDLNSGLVVFLTTLAALLFKNYIKNFRKLLLLFDSIGLGFFTLVGIKTGIVLEMHPIISITLGTITACFGGVIRDILLNNIPLIFEKDIYATTCIFGGIIFFISTNLGLNKMSIEVLCIIAVVLFRLLAVKNNWQLPAIWKTKQRLS